MGLLDMRGFIITVVTIFFCGVGLNGFMTSAYPLRKKKAEKHIEDYKNGKKEKKSEN